MSNEERMQEDINELMINEERMQEEINKLKWADEVNDETFQYIGKALDELKQRLDKLENKIT